MRGNYNIPTAERCPYCKGWGHHERPTVHGLPWHPHDGYESCFNCQGTGIMWHKKRAALGEGTE